MPKYSSRKMAHRAWKKRVHKKYHKRMMNKKKNRMTGYNDSPAMAPGKLTEVAQDAAATVVPSIMNYVPAAIPNGTRFDCAAYYTVQPNMLQQYNLVGGIFSQYAIVSVKWRICGKTAPAAGNQNVNVWFAADPTGEFELTAATLTVDRIMSAGGHLTVLAPSGRNQYIDVNQRAPCVASTITVNAATGASAGAAKIPSPWLSTQGGGNIVHYGVAVSGTGLVYSSTADIPPDLPTTADSLPWTMYADIVIKFRGVKAAAVSFIVLIFLS